MTDAPTCSASPMTPNTAVIERAAACSSLVWTPIEGYEPMENCHTGDGQEVGWIRPARIGKSRPQPWGTAADWPGEWQAIPHRYDNEGQPIDWQLSTYQPSYAAAKDWIERSWTDEKLTIGDKVLFDAERGYPISRPVRYGGTITKRLGNNYWEVIGFGFRAELSGELMTPNPVYSQNAGVLAHADKNPSDQ